jgi:uncharacterized membrane protein
VIDKMCTCRSITSLHFWRLFVGDTVSVARMMSLAFYLLSIPLLYVLGKQAYSRQVGLFAALLLALSPFMNWYGSEIRMYTLFTLLVSLTSTSLCGSLPAKKVTMLDRLRHYCTSWYLYALLLLS